MTEQASNGAAQGEQNPQFSLQRIYVRDLSFRSAEEPGNLPSRVDAKRRHGPQYPPEDAGR